MNLSGNSDLLITERFEKGLKDFFEYHSPAFLSRNLRRMALLYMRQSVREGLHSELAEFLDHLDSLFDFLDLAEEETREWRKGKI